MLRHTGWKYLITTLTCLMLTSPGKLLHGTIQDSSSPDWQVLGQFGGPVQGVVSQGRYVYAGVGPRLVSIDALDPAVMQPIGGTAQFADFVQDVTVSSDLAYVAAGSAGLRVVDISDPAHPVEIGAWDSPGYAEGVVVVGHTAYLADGPYGLAIVDISDPEQPLPISSAYSTEHAYGVSVNGQYAYLAAGIAGVLVVDVVDPDHPVESGAVDTPGYAYGVAANATVAYVADGWNGLQVVNVADPTEPTLDGVLATPGWAVGVVLSGTRVYVADAAGGIRIVDVADPASLRTLGAHAPDLGHAGSVSVAGNMAFIADRNFGVRAVDVSNPANPVQVGLYNSLGNAVRVVVAGQFSYVAAGNNGLRIMDVTDAAHPLEVGTYDTHGFALAVQVVGNFAYVANLAGRAGGCEMRVVDISNLANPTLVALFPSPFPNGAYRDLEVTDGIAYLVDEIGLQLVSVADPLHPALLSRIELMAADGHEAVGVSVIGDVAYVASSFAGLKMVDVSDPSSPTLLGQSTTEWSFAQDVVVVGNIAYLAEYNILRTVDVSDPTHPRGLGHVFTPGELYDVAVTGNTAYLAVSGQGLETADVSDPTEPVLTGGFDTIGIAHGVVTSDDYVFLADGPNGLVILAPAADGEPPSHGSLPEMPAVQLLSVEFTPNNTAGFASIPDDPPVGRWTTSFFESREPSRPPGRAAAAAPNCTVTSAADSGPGTVRACLQDARSGTVIDFSPTTFPPENPVAIMLLSPLPHFPGNVTLDASNAGVILDGSELEEGDNGLSLTSNGNTVRGLQLTGFPHSAILVMGRNNTIGGDRGEGAGPIGQGNLISGNRNMGIMVAGEEASGNWIVGNLIGTDMTGTSAWGNENIGLFLHGGAHDNTVGGLEDWQRNIICDNYYAGVAMMGSGTSRNWVVGNYVGTDVTGTRDLGNRGNGITMELAAAANLVQANVSSGNSDVGVGISDQGSDYNIIIGNRLGTDAGGTQSIPNDDGGVRAGFGGASFNRIGGTQPGEGNLISGNSIGVSIIGSNAVGNLVLGNLIGTDGSGLGALGNQNEGLVVSAGETVVRGNVVAANGGPGISLNSGSTSSFLLANLIGTAQGGAIQLGNAGPGIVITGTGINFIQGNTVAHNRSNGLEVVDGLRNTIRRNSIYSNDGAGIVLTGVGNGQLTPPRLGTDPTQGISGTTCAGCTVELFADAGDEGRYYLDSRVADDTGAFLFGRPCLPAGLGITTTVTDPTGNTSLFSAPASVSWTCGTLDLLSPRSP
ncbi:MAG: right-handed parallel beta-helix repeat-containing protein [Anaerolineales bacterium]|nr:right-handed parallel beta-helix repeat-containing protein [Anaerolineales bacterium]